MLFDRNNTRYVSKYFQIHSTNSFETSFQLLLSRKNHFPLLKRIPFRWLVRYRVILYAQSYPFIFSYFIVDITLACMMNIGTLRHSNIRFTERESALKRKGGSQKCDTVSPGRAKPETCFIRKKCMALDTKPAFFTATFQTRHYYALKEEIPSKTCSWEQSFQEVKDGKYGTKASTVEELCSPANPC